LPQLILYYALVIVSLGLFAVSATTLWWMLHAWHSPEALAATGFRRRRAGRPRSFSLVLPARHEQAVLGDTIDALARLNHPLYEVIVIIGHDDPETQRVLGWQLVGTSSLPPDWASVDIPGTAVPAGPPGGGPAQFGLDAARLPVRFAESCDPADRALAAAMRPILAAPRDLPALRNLDGSAASDWQHPVAVVAAAATEEAAGDSDAAAARLDAATALQQRYPTYFGAAWVALGRIMLSTSLLGACPDRS
jgi:hypothetical protein